MQRTHFDHMACPIAQSLERIGEWWSMLIVRDAFRGLTRFDEFQHSLGISPTMLTRRLNTLVRNDIMFKQPYQTRPVRHEYLLTERGLALFPVLISLLDWGNRLLDDDRIAIVPVHRHSGKAVTPQVIDRQSGERLTYHNVDIITTARCAGTGNKPQRDAHREISAPYQHQQPYNRTGNE
ncbi:winged helix-turn-helix transcriptional regulator [Sodalis ligni]|uniref:HxlR family transcriptional regulator n=1 Tax=Sodalis ligni TaxID=2697027 RepID=A0A4R1N7G4_9GAMM|nr:helix-turn-helix domain-containing protein [Sodalis ligni]TCL03092.1 HxlR family transcriptional regulator [Sodalis ligni]